MVFFISLLLVAQEPAQTSKPLWATSDTLIEDSLGSYVNFAADYNYSNGNIYVACIPDSGTYFGPDSMGILLFRSTDHGETWNIIFRDAYEAQYWEVKEIDLVATRNDTVYVLMSWYHDVFGHDQINIAKIWEAGGIGNIDWLLTPAIDATEIRSPKLVRDDFDDFYLYMAYLDVTSEWDTLHILRSTDRGDNWSIFLRAPSASEYQDEDIAVADSSLYHLSTFQSGPNQTLQFGYWRHRGVSAGVINLFQVNTNDAEPIQYPRIGATTTLPDTTQLVYAFFSQENSVSGNYDLLYMYSEHGGDTFAMTPDTTPDTLVQGSSSPILCDLRGYQADTNRWMNLTYCFTSSGPNFENFWCWSEEGSPTNWQGTASVGTGANRSVPELIYSPGAPGGGGAVVYNDSLGNLWFDAPWFPAGIADNSNENKDNIISKVILAGSIVDVGSAGAVVYDVTGREIKKLNTSSWDLKDGKGEEVKGGIYFIVDEENGIKIKLSILK